MKPPLTPKQWSLALALVLVSVLAVTPFLDQRAVQNYESLFQRAIVTFALARTLNGVISAVQGTEVALQPAGVGVTLTPGEVLDPVNDLVERFSWIMLGATLSLGVQNVLLEISAWWVLQGIVVILSATLLFLYLGRKEETRGARQWLWKALLVAVFLRFAVPLTLVANEAVYHLFLETRYTESTEVITSAGEAFEQINQEQAEAAQSVEEAGDATVIGSILGSVGDALGGMADSVNLSEKVDRIQERAGEVIENLIQLSVVFILQTGVLPVAFLWVFLQLAKWIFRPPGSS